MEKEIAAPLESTIVRLLEIGYAIVKQLRKSVLLTMAIVVTIFRTSASMMTLEIVVHLT